MARDSTGEIRETGRPAPLTGELADVARNADGTVDVEALVSELTLEEKVGQMVQMPLLTDEPGFCEWIYADVQAGGALFDGGGATKLDPAELAEWVDDLQAFAIEATRHGIPFVLGTDAIHGNAVVEGGTVFPHAVGFGATRNVDLAERAAERTAESLRSVGVRWNYAPTADVQRDPRWGRFYEGYSEDPFLTAEMASAVVRGNERRGVGACVKHVAGYSASENGNDRTSTNASMRDLRTNVLPAYDRALAAEPDSVMVSSGAINGVPAHASSWLLTTVLRERWGYDGLVTSDWSDLGRMIVLHDYVDDYRDAIRLGINAGIDTVMFPRETEEFVPLTVDLVESGEVPESRIDDAVHRMLEFKRNRGLFDDPYVWESVAEDRLSGGTDVARTAAEQSMTLLENRGDALPLDDGDSVLLTGPASDAATLLAGGWTLGWQTVGDGTDADGLPSVTTIHEGLSDALPADRLAHEPTGFEYVHQENYDEFAFDEAAVTSAAEAADVVVVTLAEGPYAEWYGDRDDLSLPDAQRELVATLAEAVGDDATLVGVLVAGRPRGGERTFRHLDALLMAYLPGTAGGTAVANALVGERDPSGRLPFVWPESVGMVPTYVDMFPEAREFAVGDDDDAFDRDPLYEFGRGLSYADFEYADLAVTPDSVDDPADQGTVAVTVTVENAGERAAEHVVDVFTAGTDGSVMHPRRRLLGSGRVALDPGEHATVEVTVPLRYLEVVPGDVVALDEKAVEAGEYELSVGDRTTTLTVEETGSVTGRGPMPTS